MKQLENLHLLKTLNLCVLETVCNTLKNCFHILIGDITLAKTSCIRLHGKGNKTREIPISSDAAKFIKKYLTERGKFLKDNHNEHLFPSQRSDTITTACIRNLFRKYVSAAKEKKPDLFKEEGYSPHSLRHSKAIHMLEAGVPLIYIRNFLGHESVQTTEIICRSIRVLLQKSCRKWKCKIQFRKRMNSQL